MVTVRGGYIAAVTPQDQEHDRLVGVKEFRRLGGYVTSAWLYSVLYRTYALPTHL